MKSKEEIRDWLLENCVNQSGNLDLSGLDFSDFDGSVYISNMKVKHFLFQDHQQAGEALTQYRQKVEGHLLQYDQTVGEDLYQDEILSKDTLKKCIDLLSQDGNNTKEQVKNILINLLEENE